MEPTKGAIHLDQPLTDFSIAYKEDEKIVRVANEIFSPVAVNHRSDKFFTFGKHNMLLLDTEVAPNAAPQVIQWEPSSETYSCVMHKLRGCISLDDLADQDPGMEIERFTMLAINEIFDRAFEYKVALKCVGTSPSFSNGHAFVNPLNRWDDYANSDPLGDIEDAKKSIEDNTNGHECNLMVISKDVWRILKYHPDVLDHLTFQAPMGGVRPTILTEEAFAALIGIDKVIIANQMMIDANYAGIGTTTPTFLWSKGCFFAHVEPGGGLMSLSAGKGFYWTGRGEGGSAPDSIQGASVGAANVYSWDVIEDDFRFIQLKMYVDPKVTCDGAGYYMTSVIT